jgi:hypothetical protein
MQMNENFAAKNLSENYGCVNCTQFYCSIAMNALQAGHFAAPSLDNRHHCAYVLAGIGSRPPRRRYD